MLANIVFYRTFVIFSIKNNSLTVSQTNMIKMRQQSRPRLAIKNRLAFPIIVIYVVFLTHDIK